MHPRRRTLLGLPLLVAVSPAHAGRSRVGEVTSLAGAATALFSGDPPRALAPQGAILMEDLLTTGPAARLACRLDGGLLLQLGENAGLRVDMATLRGPRPGVAIRNFGGPVLLDIPTGAPPIPTSLTLPWAHVGVRGTRFFAGESDGRDAVFVERGRVEVTVPAGSVTLSEGEGVDVAGSGLGPVTRWGAARIARAMALVT